jgi:hypothetical protein
MPIINCTLSLKYHFFMLQYDEFVQIQTCRSPAAIGNINNQPGVAIWTSGI